MRKGLQKRKTPKKRIQPTFTGKAAAILSATTVAICGGTIALIQRGISSGSHIHIPLVLIVMELGLVVVDCVYVVGWFRSSRK